MVEIILLAAVSFAATNIDDMLLNMVFFAACADNSQRRSVLIGKFFATAVMVVVAAIGGIGMQTFAHRYVWLLGLVPLFLGVKELVYGFRNDEEKEATALSPQNIAFSTLRITLASGADNIGIYVPLFASVQAVQMAVCTAVFFALTGVWCIVADRLTQFSTLQSAIEKYRKIIVPAVYICLGMYIIMSK